MKTILILLISSFINSCGGINEANTIKSTASNDDFRLSTTASKMDQNNIVTIEYSAITRGSFKEIKATKENISFQKNRSKQASVKDCSEKEWSELMVLLKAIDLDLLSKLEAPSKKHQFDGAAIASLIVTVNEKSYQTPSFDDGNPPKEIESLVKYILTIAETVE